MIFGTFDTLHPGHTHMLKEAKEYGDYLVAVIARDKTILKVKHKKPIYNEKQRFANLKKLDIADKVILGRIGDKYAIINKEKPDIIALGYDQRTFVDELEDNIQDNTQIVRLCPFKPHKYKSSIILKNR